MEYSYPKAIRLKRSSEFLRVKRKGASFGGRYLILGVLPEAVPGVREARVGIIASRRVGGAVTRSRVRRRFREIARLSRPEWGQSGAWIVIVTRAAAEGAPYAEVAREWRRLLRRAGLLAKSAPRGET